MANFISNNPFLNTGVMGNYRPCPCSGSGNFMAPQMPAPMDQMSAMNWGQVARYNPFAEFAMFVAMVMVEAWSANRTPAPGMIARNDCLPGMLLNQGYTLEEIYGCDDHGYSILDRVAAANNLRNPNMLTPNRTLTLPSRYAPKQPIEFGGYSNGNQSAACTSIDTLSNADLLTFAQANGIGAKAKAQTSTGTVVNSTVVTEAVAQGPQAQAEAQTNAGTVVNSTIVTEAVAQGPRAEALAETSASNVVNSTLTTEATAEGPQSQAQAQTDVESAVDATLVSEATADGPASAGTFAETATNSVLVAQAESTEGPAEAYAENGGWTRDGGAVVSAEASTDAHAEALGVEQAQATVVSQTGEATLVVDAAQTEAVLVGQDARATTQGNNGQAHFDMDVQDTAAIEDPTQMYGQPTGNSISSDVRGQHLDVRTGNSAAVDGSFLALDGDNFVRGNLPQGGQSSKLDLNLSNGNDRVELQRGADDDRILISKTEGVLDLNLHNGVGMDDIGRNTTIIDANGATVTGLIGGSQGDDLTVLRGSDFDNLKLAGGTGGNDQLIIDLPDGAAIPSVVVEQGSQPFLGIFGSATPDLGAIAPVERASGQVISAPDFESVMIRQNGQIVSSYNPTEMPASFDDLMASARG